MRKLFFALFATLIIFSSAAFADKAPTADECDKITILTPNAWVLRIQKDGSAELSYGRMVRDTTTVKTGSFDFKKVFSNITSDAKETGDVLSTFTVSLGKDSESDSNELYSTNIDLIKKLFLTAKNNTSFNTFFNSAWKNNPPGLPD